MAPASIDLPLSYANLATAEVTVTHVPPSSPTPTQVLLVTLNRLNNHNAFTKTMQQELVRVYSMFDVDDRVKCMVLTGAGTMFCAGADLDVGFNALNESTREAEHRDGGGRVALAIHHCSKPTIAAINGPAVGIGITMTLPAAIRLASSTAKVGFVFSRRGLVTEACSSYFLPRLIGLSRAMHLTATGSVYSASDPLLKDLFSEILPTPEATVTRALEMANDIAKNTSVVSTSLMKAMMHYGPNTPEGAHLLESRLLAGLFGSKDNDEGVKSFLAKRPPQFRGKMPDDAPGVYPWWEPVNVANTSKASETKSKL